VELSIVMPCLNEAETVGTCIRKAFDYMARREIVGEVIVADNGSTDGSQELARQLSACVVHVSTKGYGAALSCGTVASRGEYVVMGDADDSYDFSDLDAFLDKLRQGHDLVIGNRFKGGIAPGAMPWKNRYIGNPALSFIGRLLFGVPVRDFQCGLRGFSRTAFDRMQLKTTGMEYASEMVIKAHLKQMKIANVPTTLSPDGRSRAPHLRPWRDGFRHLFFMLGLYLRTLRERFRGGRASS
jgi:glycosyltransferase involved in cell wall biosynthesis